MRQLILLISISFAFSIGFSQGSLVIEGSKPAFYLIHKVLPRENFYSIGRLYNVSPKEIAPFNNIELAKGLSLDQSIRIPLTVNNFSHIKEAALTESLIPVYHTIATSQPLVKVASAFDDDPENFKKWNNIKKSTVSKGNKVIVGFLKVSKELSAFANKSIKTIPAVETSNNNSIVQKESATESKPVTPKSNEDQVKPNSKAQPDEKKAIQAKEISKSSINFKGGFFMNIFEQQSKNRTEVSENGIAAVFKTTSGWQDGKYYCFYNTAQQGTIVKITNSKTGRTIFAKVLDQVPEIKQNTGLSLLVSNAAAEELGVTDPKFDCTIVYNK